MSSKEIDNECVRVSEVETMTTFLTMRKTKVCEIFPLKTFLGVCLVGD